MSIKVCIVLCTYNGERYLREQLQSICSQTYQNWVLVASDDGSSDGTWVILKEFESLNPGKVILLHGPKRGFGLNFLSALRRSPESDVYAFCDQDDVWEVNKLQAIVTAFDQKPKEGAFFFISAYTIYGLGVREKTVLPFSKAFLEVLFHHLAPGNVMAFDSLLKEMLLRVEGSLPSSVAHDKLLTLFALGSGASVHICPQSLVRYRQHESNTIGAKTFYKRAARFLNRLMAGEGLIPAGYLAALCSIIDILDSDSRGKVETLFKLLRGRSSIRERMSFAWACLKNISRGTKYLIALVVLFVGVCGSKAGPDLGEGVNNKV